MANNSKTLTLKEALDRAKNFSDEKIVKKLETFDIQPKKNKIITWNYIRGGKNISHMFCPKCGTDWEHEISQHLWQSFVCPCCGKAEEYVRMATTGEVQMYLDRKNELLAVLDMDMDAGYILFGAVTPALEYRREDLDIQSCIASDNFQFMHGNWKVNEANSDVKKIIFLAGKGFRVLSETGKSLVALSGNNCLRRFLCNDYVIPRQLPELLAFVSKYISQDITENEVMEKLSVYSSDMIHEQKAKRKVPVPSSDVNDLFRPTEITDTEIRHAEKEENYCSGVVTDTYGKFQKIHVYCGCCGDFSDITVESSGSNVHSVCPICGNTMKFVPIKPQCHRSESFEAEYFDIMPDTGYIVERLFDIQEDFSDSFTKSCVEKKRIFYTDKTMFCLTSSDGAIWRKDSVPCHNYAWGFALGADLMQDKADIKALIEQSCLKYSGVSSAWGLDGSKALERIGTFSKDSYIFRWYKLPCLEKLVKVGLNAAVFDLICGQSKIEVANKNGKTVTDILGISKPVLNIARELNLNMREIQYCKQFYNMDQTITAQDYLELEGLGSPFEFEQLSREYNLSFRRIREYLTSCYEHQCIEKKQALQIWSDYLCMAEKLKYNLKDKDKKFPSSLKKEHDIAVFAYRRVEDQISKETFALQYQKNKFFEYEKGNLLVKVPETAEEIISEANQQKNCVASYVNRVCNGQTVVAFIRHKDAPETSYVTMEILQGEIRQLRAFANAPVRDRETLDFVKSFAANKNLLVNYR